MPEAKERPILFSGEMVRAILDGRKTMTRRIVKSPYKDANGQPSQGPFKWVEMWEGFSACLDLSGDGFDEDGNQMRFVCPYGVPGDRLWVRETWHEFHEVDANDDICHGYYYRADGYDYFDGIKWRPSIYMPRRASRITLEITGVRVERVQDISEEDAEAEGIEPNWCGPLDGWDKHKDGWRNYLQNEYGEPAYTASESFQTLWDSLYSESGFGWEANPWVYVISFRRMEKESSPCPTN